MSQPNANINAQAMTNIIVASLTECQSKFSFILFRYLFLFLHMILVHINDRVYPENLCKFKPYE